VSFYLEERKKKSNHGPRNGAFLFTLNNKDLRTIIKPRWIIYILVACLWVMGLVLILQMEDISKALIMKAYIAGTIAAPMLFAKK
jgi:hypothetical protein